MLEWLIVADDRTGALEVAGEVAAWLGPVTVTVGRPAPGVDAAVVDIGARHVTPAAAAERAVAATATPARHAAHKIDSLLRGNWAHELVAVQRAFGGRVLLVPALPRMGRVCRGGVVHVGGVPVGGPDARRASSSPRPADHLEAAGAADVAELATAAAARKWAADGGTFAVCDASSDDDLAAIADAWRGTDVRFAGTAGSIAAAVAATAARCADRRPVVPAGDVLVVCGSLHPTARTQLDAVRARCDPAVTVVASPEPDGPSIAAACAERVAAELGATARELLAAGTFGVLVVVGGDTAAAVLGDDPLVAGGTFAPGVPWSRRVDGDGPLVLTKAGGFGQATTLVDLLAGVARSEGR
jgi:uncharacterized protein YgbK (DUF1537 family)